MPSFFSDRDGSQMRKIRPVGRSSRQPDRVPMAPTGAPKAAAGTSLHCHGELQTRKLRMDFRATLFDPEKNVFL